MNRSYRTVFNQEYSVRDMISRARRELNKHLVHYPFPRTGLPPIED
jgi:hypothetical protein